MLGAMQDRIPHPSVVFLAERGQDHRLGQLWADQPLTFERGPDRWVAQPRRIARRDDGLAEVEMVAMRVGELCDRKPPRLILGGRLTGDAPQLLQQGQRL